MKARLTIVFVILMLCMCQVSCSGKKGSSGKESQQTEQDSDKKGYIIFINADTPKKNIMYSSDASGKKKEKIYDKNISGASGRGEKIAFISKEQDKTGLYMINADGSSLVPIINDINIKNNSICWSADGKRIAFVAKQPTDKNNTVYYVEVGKSKTPVKVTEDGIHTESPRFSNDGKFIVYTQNQNNNYDIFKYEFATKNNVNISNNGTNDISPVVSPDGTKIFFLSDEKSKDKYNLYTMDLEGKNRVELTTDLNIEKDSIRISPDSSMISFVAVNDRKNKTVHVMDMNKTTIMISDDAYMAEWSNDSKKLYYAAFDTKNRKIVEYDITGKTMKDAVKIENKPGEDIMGIKFLYFTDKIK